MGAAGGGAILHLSSSQVCERDAWEIGWVFRGCRGRVDWETGGR